MTTKLKAPEGVAGGCFEGVEVRVDSTGYITLESHASIQAALTHGFTVADEQSKPNPTVTKAEELRQVLSVLPGDHDDPDYVVSGMRGHFGALITAEVEAKIRELVPNKKELTAQAKASAELSAALATLPDAIATGDVADAEQAIASLQGYLGVEKLPPEAVAHITELFATKAKADEEAKAEAARVAKEKTDAEKSKGGRSRH